jgi:hypothetical protein
VIAPPECGGTASSRDPAARAIVVERDEETPNAENIHEDTGNIIFVLCPLETHVERAIWYLETGGIESDLRFLALSCGLLLASQTHDC